MNQQTKDKHLSNPYKCPVCESPDITLRDQYAETTQNLYMYMRCDACESEWTEEYTITDVWVTSTKEQE